MIWASVLWAVALVLVLAAAYQLVSMPLFHSLVLVLAAAYQLVSMPLFHSQVLVLIATYPDYPVLRPGE
jgi:chromate transport protein ChrA